MSRVRQASASVLAGIAALGAVIGLAAQGTPVPDMPAEGRPLTGPGGERVVHVFDEPMHRTVLHRGATRIIDVQIPPGSTSLFHAHTSATLYMPVVDSPSSRIQVLGRDWPAPPPGATARTPLATLPRLLQYPAWPVIHRVENTGQSLFRWIGIVNLNERGSRANGPAPAPGGTAEVDNEYFRGYRHAVAAGAAVSGAAADAPIVLVQVGDGRLELDGPAGEALGATGTIAYVAPGAAFSVRNPDIRPVGLAVVEVRSAAP